MFRLQSHRPRGAARSRRLHRVRARKQLLLLLSQLSRWRLLLAVRSEQRAEKALRFLDRWFVGQFKPVHILVHIWPERTRMAHLDTLLFAQAHCLTILDHGAFGENVRTEFAHQIVGLIEGQRAFRLDFHALEVAHTERRYQDVAVWLLRELN